MIDEVRDDIGGSFRFQGALVAWSLLEPLPGSSRSAAALSQQRQAVRDLVDRMLGSDVMIGHDAEGAPQLLNRAGFISISHCSRAVAIAWHPQAVVGVDVEVLRPQLMRVKHKFLSPNELLSVTTLPALLNAWTSKEALYKALLTPGLPLVDIPLTHPSFHILTTSPAPDLALSVVVKMV